MNRILFVDDDPNVLGGLANLLRAERRRWEVVCVPSADAALERLGREAFDVVVSDMRMPHMDGAALLARVKQLYPATARLVMSGHADPSAVLRALPVAQQYLAKPCDPLHLRQVIERTCALNSLLSGEAVRRAAGTLDKLPSVPTTYLALTQAMARSNLSMAEVVKILEQDPAMCAKVLQLVNSAYFGLSHRLTSLRQAVTYLGLELLASLVLSAHIFGTVAAESLGGLCLESVQQHALATARLVRQFAVGDKKLAEDVFASAVVHDVGEIVLALALGPEYGRVRQLAESRQPRHLVESEELGASHAEVGAYLLGLWGLPFAVVEAVAHHHRPSRLGRREDCRLVAALHVADAMADGEGGTAALDQAFLDGIDCRDEVERWLRLAAAPAREECHE